MAAYPPSSPSAASSNDTEHLTYIVSYCDFLGRWTNRVPPLFLPTDAPEFTNALVDSSLWECREGLSAIARSVNLLSRDARERANKMIQGPMTCFTIEALGATMVPFAGYEPMARPDNAFTGKLHKLLLESELLVEAAVPDILEADLPKMRSVFAYLLQLPGVQAPKAIRFVATQALVQHLYDARALQRLLFLSNNLDEAYTSTQLAREVDQRPAAILRTTAKGLIRYFEDSPSTDRRWYAAARFLQLIGELLGNLSKRTQALHPSLPFDDFEMVRHGLTHPEEHGWDRVYADLMQDDDQLPRVIEEVMSELPDRLGELIAMRWPENGDISWPQLYGEEERAQTTPARATAPCIQPADGQARKKETKAERTKRKKEDAERRKAEKEAAEERQRQAQQATRQSAGFALLGALAKKFRSSTSSPPVRLPPIEQVRLARQALENVHNYLSSDPALQPSLLDRGWEKDVAKRNRFYERLCECPELHHAIEFNGGQAVHLLLCLFDGHKLDSEATREEREEIVGNLTNAAPLGLDVIRTLRNYIAHGDALIDLPDPYEHDKPPVRPRHTVIAPKMAHLVVTLLPALRQILNNAAC